ncbi:membrane-bound lytic murein transglycosylase MltF [Porticoccus sp. W117]|uniref:membrane-bound lytic murein transglycosylase MltF n=1 Tax=Porticoccus sp. W117 TaxID=3054777 RepID=UPI00259481F0|nr:membrane-bound lytic murein transglycosylase MltF [Porticoccus sp. W117]MDM3870143.1 membrane-bound lytic murein transglycosylase MltF [Porticoccus sp. W117]
MKGSLARRIIGTALLRVMRLGSLMIPLACTAALLHSSTTISDLQRVQARGYLKVITIPGPITYYQNAKGDTGFEYLLAKGFADYLDVKLRVSQVNNLNGLAVSLGGPNGDFAAAGLSTTLERRKYMLFSDSYGNTSQELLYKLGTKRPKSFAELKPGSTLLSIANSAGSEQLQAEASNLPQVNWQQVQLADTLGLMEQIHSGEAEYAVVDSMAHEVNQSLYPNARIAFQVSEQQTTAWAFPFRNDTSLLDAANDYLRTIEANGKLEKLREQFFGHNERFNIAGSQLFMRRVNDRLPKFEELFREAASEFNTDWQLLAAIAYQESHWNAKAKSPTGVRGLMMLTWPTAREMGVKNRLNARQSLMAGTQYYLKTKKRLPERITEPDRTWMALASYNVGFGHLEDARVLTERAGKNPDLWEDVREHLPLLEQKKYYSTVKRGFARGREPVSYVQNIRHYRDILQWHHLEKERKEMEKEEQEFAEKLAADM